MATNPMTDAHEDWDARFEAALAAMLRQYLKNDPPPPDSAIGSDAAEWATNLELLAERRRVAFGPEEAMA